MKCVSIKGAKKLQIKEIEEPISDGSHVIIDVLKTGICGSDLHNFESGAPKDLVMGHEFCGIVKDRGNRKDLKIGDRVTALPISPCMKCDSCLSGNVQYCPETWTYALGLSLAYPGGLTKTIKVRSDMVCKVPKSMSDEEVCMVEPTAVCLHAINLAEIKKGNKVLVIGAGAIGLESMMLAKYKKSGVVVVSETNEARGNKALEMGLADKFFNPVKDDINDLINEFGGFDIVIECCGNSSAVNSALTLAKPGAKIILVGVSNTPIEFFSALAVTKELKIYGSIAYTPSEFLECIYLISKKKIDVARFVTDIVELKETQQAYERLISGTDPAIKILVDPNK